MVADFGLAECPGSFHSTSRRCGCGPSAAIRPNRFASARLQQRRRRSHPWPIIGAPTEASKPAVPGSRTELPAPLLNEGITLGYSDKIAQAKGISTGGAITILPGMEPAEEFPVLVHEYALENLHRDERRSKTDKAIRETEAEAVAFVVCHAIGLATSTAASDYI